MLESYEPTVNGRRPSKPDPLVGTWLDGRFLIEARIATGGFGAIYRGRSGGGLPVALKVLHPALVGDPNMVARFQREGAILTQLHDPHTVATLAVGETPEGTLYIAMELLSGETLHDRLRRDRMLPWQTAVAIARSVCSSLAEAHALGVVHRDLKPANIHIERRDDADFVKVIDFGIVKIARGSAIDDGQELTHAGHLIGTSDYMSPEQIIGEGCGGASDIYSLGVVLYEMLTGRRPFARATTPAALLTALLTQTPEPPSVLAAIPPALDRIVMRCLERDPQQRFASVVELAAKLARLLAQRPTARDEITAVHPVWIPSEADGQTIDDAQLRARIEREADAAPDDERTWAARPSISATARRNPPDGPLCSTLQGMAVATERKSRPGTAVQATPAASKITPRTHPAPGSAILRAAQVVPAGSAVTPMAWHSTPRSSSIPALQIRCEPLARGSSPTLQPRSYGLLWAALVLAGLLAIVLAATL